MARTKQCSSGAVCSCLVNKIHPGLEVEAKFPNRTKLNWLDGHVAIRWEPKKVKKKEQVCIVFHHCNFPNKEVHEVEWWVKVLKEGAAEHFFGGEAGGATQ
eukprot:4635220-Ditylum_brightwellii.AAC.1